MSDRDDAATLGKVKRAGQKIGHGIITLLGGARAEPIAQGIDELVDLAPVGDEGVTRQSPSRPANGDPSKPIRAEGGEAPSSTATDATKAEAVKAAPVIYKDYDPVTLLPR